MQLELFYRAGPESFHTSQFRKDSRPLFALDGFVVRYENGKTQTLSPKQLLAKVGEKEFDRLNKIAIGSQGTGNRGMAQHPPANAKDHRPVPIHERLEGHVIAPVEESAQELAIAEGCGRLEQRRLAQVAGNG